MKVGGFGELENLRKSQNQKDTARTSRRSGRPDGGGQSRKTDAVELSGPARLMGKLSQVPEIRAERVEAIKGELERGEYLTEEKVKDGIRKMLEQI
jgi:anti-sigma28 factor (negative regulator of flagellin synthesis)